MRKVKAMYRIIGLILIAMFATGCATFTAYKDCVMDDSKELHDCRHILFDSDHDDPIEKKVEPIIEDLT